MEQRLSNVKKGDSFHEAAAPLLAHQFGTIFSTHKFKFPYPIGNPPKTFRVDLVSDDELYIGDCKDFNWRPNGQIPNGKIADLLAVVLKLLAVRCSHEPIRFIAMNRHVRNTPQREQQSLAEHFFEYYGHLLNGVRLIEVDLETEDEAERVRELKPSS